MKVTYTATKEDFWNFYKHIYYNTRESKLRLGLSIFLGILASIPLYYLTYSITKAIAIPTVVFLFTLYLRYPRVKRKVYKNAKYQRSILVEQTIEINEEGISSVTDSDNSFFKWTTINSIEMTDEYLFIFLNRVTAIIIPNRIFSSKDEVIQFYNTATTFMDKAKQK